MSGIVQGLIASFKSAAAAADEFFNRVTLLLNTSSTNGAQNNTFLDSSTNNFTITRNGNTTQGTFTPFSQTGWSNNFVRSSSQFLSISNSTGDFNFGTGALTIECWVNLSSMPSGSGYPASYWLFGGGPINSDPGIDLYITSTQLGFNLVDFVSPTVIGNHGMSVGNWYHVAVVRGGTSNQTVSIYVNGTRVATASSVTASAATTSNISISAAEPSGSTGGNLDGYISNYRVVKGTAVYDPTSSTLTVPTTPLTSISNTVLLTCQANRFVDSNTQTTAKDITLNGTPRVQAFSPFAPTAAYDAAVVGGSGYFDGTGDYLTYTTPSNSVIVWATNDFTIEAFVYPTSLTGFSYVEATANHPTLIGNRNPTGAVDYWSFGPLTDGRVCFHYFSGSQNDVISTATVKLNQWNHIAMTKTTSGVSIFVNGVGTTATAINGTPQNSNAVPLTIGQGNNGTTSYAISGYVSGIRLLNGTALYSGTTYTIPTAPPTAITNTSLLLNYTNSGIFDSTAKNVLETVGNAQVSTTQAKWGTTSMAFDGTGDYLLSRYLPNLEFGSGDFTVECWVYFSTLPSNAAATIVSYGDSDNTPRWLLYYDSRTGSANGLRFTVINGSATAIIAVEGGGTSGWAANTWYHVAVTRSGSSWRLFRDGTQTGSTVTDTDAIPAASNNGLVVGAEPNGSVLLNGYIDDLRITTGYARYTANFTAPTAAFPLQ